MPEPLEGLFEVPKRIAVCPYCDAPLTVQPEAWEKDPGESWKVSGAMVECTTEPDIESDEWGEWIAIHSEMPYVYQLPVDERVIRWLNRARSPRRIDVAA